MKISIRGIVMLIRKVREMRFKAVLLKLMEIILYPPKRFDPLLKSVRVINEDRV